MEFDDVAADAEGAAFEIDVVAGVLQIDQLAEHLVAVGGFTLCGSAGRDAL